MDKGEALSKLRELVGQDLRELADRFGIKVWINGKMQKGWAGHVVERYLGIPLNSSRNPNLGSWELKVVPLKPNAGGHWGLKETMWITTIDPVEVAKKSFEESHLYRKLRKVIVVSRTRENPQETRSICRDVHAFDLEETALYSQVVEDYRAIQRVIREDGFEALNGNIGVYVQPRTKGKGHGSKSRAFYAKKNFLEYITGREESPRLPERLAIGMCPVHSGQDNEASRQPLEGHMASLPANQSGAGRHKCPYCAYEEGYRQALVDASTAVERLRA